MSGDGNPPVQCTKQPTELQFNIPPKFEQQSICTLRLQSDAVERVVFTLKMPPAPYGFAWRRLYPHFLFKKMELVIGNQSIWTGKTESFQAFHMIYPSDQEAVSLFDMDLDARKQASLQEHEILFEPMNLKQIFLHDPKIKYSEFPLHTVRMAFHQIHIIIHFGNLTDCIERIHGNAPMVLNPPPFECKLYTTNVFMETSLRRELGNLRKVETRTIQNTIDSVVIPTPSVDNTTLSISIASVATSMVYIHLTDLLGNEIPTQCIESIKMMFNGVSRIDIPGYYARFGQREYSPHPIQPNNRSVNLYYLSLHNGTYLPDNGYEYGTHLGRVEDYQMVIEWKSTFTTPVCIRVFHRCQNTARTMSGMFGLSHANYSSMQVKDSIVIQQVVNDIVPIPITPREPICMITHELFVEDQKVLQCTRCTSTFGYDTLMVWINGQSMGRRECPVCKIKYSTTTFTLGKIHLDPAP